MNEWDGMGWEMQSRPDGIAVSKGRSIIDCPGNCQLAARAEHERYQTTNHAQPEIERPRKAPRNGKFALASKNDISKT